MSTSQLGPHMKFESAKKIILKALSNKVFEASSIMRLRSRKSSRIFCRESGFAGYYQ